MKRLTVAVILLLLAGAAQSKPERPRGQFWLDTQLAERYFSEQTAQAVLGREWDWWENSIQDPVRDDQCFGGWLWVCREPGGDKGRGGSDRGGNGNGNDKSH